MYATNYLEKSFLNIMKNITLTAPNEVYAGLYITNPGEEGKGVEVNYKGYERQIIKFNNASESDGQIQIKNLNQINFPQSPTDAGTITYIGISDSKLGGNMLAYGKLVEDLDIRSGESPVLMAEEIVVFSTGQLSKTYKKKLLHVFKGESIQGVEPHLALFNGNPENGGAELLGDNYERVLIEFKSPEESSSGQSIISNSNEVIFNRPSTDWGVWNFTAVMDNKTNGEPIWIYDRGIVKELKRGYMPKAEVGALKFAIN